MLFPVSHWGGGWKVVGESRLPSSTAAAWSSGGTIESLTVSGSSARAVSIDGTRAVGYFTVGANQHACIFTKGAVQDLGTLNPAGGNSIAHGVSANGTIVTGTDTSLGTTHSFLWTSSSGMVDLGLYGGNSPVAENISGDGSTVVGSSGAAAIFYRGGVWTKLPDLSASPFGSFATCASFDGSVIGGGSYDITNTLHAVYWTNGVLTDLGTVATSVTGISSDGLTMCGTTTSTVGFVWTALGGFVSIGTLPGGTASNPRGISPDGKYVVGNANSTLGNQAFSWTATGGIVGLGFLPTTTASTAYAVSNL